VIANEANREGIVPGILGVIQAAEAIKYVLGAGRLLNLLNREIDSDESLAVVHRAYGLG